MQCQSMKVGTKTRNIEILESLYVFQYVIMRDISEISCVFLFEFGSCLLYPVINNVNEHILKDAATIF